MKAYRTLSENICQSFKKGEPVIVTGVLATETWNGENGESRSRTVLEASNAGHDLNYGVTALRRFAKPNAANAESATQTPAARSNAGVQIASIRTRIRRVRPVRRFRNRWRYCLTMNLNYNRRRSALTHRAILRDGRRLTCSRMNMRSRRIRQGRRGIRAAREF